MCHIIDVRMLPRYSSRCMIQGCTSEDKKTNKQTNIISPLFSCYVYYLCGLFSWGTYRIWWIMKDGWQTNLEKHIYVYFNIQISVCVCVCVCVCVLEKERCTHEIICIQVHISPIKHDYNYVMLQISYYIVKWLVILICYQLINILCRSFRYQHLLWWGIHISWIYK